MSNYLKDRIQANRQRWKYARLLNRLHLKYYEYEDSGKMDKYNKVVEKCRNIIKKHQVKEI